MTEEGLKSLEARVRTLELSDAESGAHRTYVAARLDKIESNTTWIVRSVLGLVIAAVVGLALYGGSP
jgi:hypothetical protein